MAVFFWQRLYEFPKTSNDQLIYRIYVLAYMEYYGMCPILIADKIFSLQDLLWRDVMVYKGRIDLDQCDIYPLEDGKGSLSLYKYFKFY